MLASRFKVFCADSGLSIDEVGKLLRVTPRTVRYWFSGKTSVPYAAYKLLRILRLFELPGQGWDGWRMHSGKLWTPEGRSIEPIDGSWWSLLVRQARCFRSLYQRSADFERALMMLGAKGLQSSDAGRFDRGSNASPLAEDAVGAGSGAEGPANLLIRHIATVESTRVSGERTLTNKVMA